MNYNEIIVSHEHLKDSVLCFWQMTGSIDKAAGVDLRHTPKGQNLLIFNFGDPIEQLDDSDVVFLNASFFVVPAIASSRIFKQKGKIDLLGVSFISDGLFNFLQEPVSTLQNGFPDGLKIKCEALFRELENLTFERRAKAIEDFLINHINHKKKNPAFNKAIALINKTRGCIKVSDIAKKVFVTERQLQRLFRSRLGISPKDYCKVVRVNSYIEFILAKGKAVDWMELVVAFDYHDQPHLVNEIKSITNLSPKKLINYRDTLYDLYSY